MIRPALPGKLLICLMLAILASCREDEVIIPTEYTPVGDFAPEGSKVVGFYLVNEGNMGSNKCTVDFYDYLTGLYCRNIYAEKNPGVIKELGDVGNAIGIYGSKLYIVVNCSHKVEVLDAVSGVRLGQIDIPNCRSLAFDGGRAYVSSYVGPVHVSPDAPKGAVYEVDTLQLKVTRQVSVGYQPEEMAVVGEYMYVANSGGYRAPNYDHTVSVIKLSDFKQVEQIPVGINLHGCKKDRYGKVWVTSGGNHEEIPSRIFVLDKKPGHSRLAVTDTLNIPCSSMAFSGDSLLVISTQWSDVTLTNTVSYGVIDVRTKQLVSNSFIAEETRRMISRPYGIAVHPETGDIFVTDAKNYVSSGTLYCFTRQGTLKWSVRTGDIPAHVAFLTR